MTGRSLSRVCAVGDLLKTLIEGECFVEYYDMPDAFAFLARFIARKQYNAMLVDDEENQ